MSYISCFQATIHFAHDPAAILSFQLIQNVARILPRRYGITRDGEFSSCGDYYWYND
jgi:hypothetical protein